MTWSVSKTIKVNDGNVRGAIIAAINAIESVPRAAAAQLNAAKRAAEACASAIECKPGKVVCISLGGHDDSDLNVSIRSGY